MALLHRYKVDIVYNTAKELRLKELYRAIPRNTKMIRFNTYRVHAVGLDIFSEKQALLQLFFHFRFEFNRQYHFASTLA